MNETKNDLFFFYSLIFFDCFLIIFASNSRLSAKDLTDTKLLFKILRQKKIIDCDLLSKVCQLLINVCHILLDFCELLISYCCLFDIIVYTVCDYLLTDIS